MTTFIYEEDVKTGEFIHYYNYSKFEGKLFKPKSSGAFMTNRNDQQTEFLKYSLPKNKYAYHDGYIEYLMCAYMNEHGIEIGPWHLWNIILSQICDFVKNNCEPFRHIFTASDEKITIEQTTTEIDVDMLIDQINNLCPTNLKRFLPEFENAPSKYDISMKGLVADMVQNYYSCMVYGMERL